MLANNRTPGITFPAVALRTASRRSFSHRLLQNPLPAASAEPFVYCRLQNLVFAVSETASGADPVRVSPAVKVVKSEG